MALALATATFQAVERVGMPESNYILYHCATALARSEKSREVSELMYAAKDLAKRYPDLLPCLSIFAMHQLSL